MKKLMIAAVVAFSGAFAFAGALDVDHGPVTGGKKITFPYCEDGEQRMFTEYDSNFDRSYSVLRTCTDGRWYPKTNPRIIKCKEGSTAFWSVARPGLDRYDNVLYVCHNGKWVEKN